MAIFGVDKTDRQIDELLSRLQKSELERKELASELAVAHQKISDLESSLAMKEAKINEALRAVMKARKRQKNSVERANRFKARLNQTGQPS